MKPLNKRLDPSVVAKTTKRAGDEAELEALRYLQKHGMRLLCRNYRTPGRGGGEIDLIMRDPRGTCVFIEVRARASSQFGGAGASVGKQKQRRIAYAARHYLLAQRTTPPCRFDVVVLQPEGIEWLQAAFEAPESHNW
jgi:putative endonuclease